MLQPQFSVVIKFKCKILRFLSLAVKAVGIEVKTIKIKSNRQHAQGYRSQCTIVKLIVKCQPNPSSVGMLM